MVILRNILGLHQRFDFAEPMEVGPYGDWDYVVWHIPHEMLPKNGLEGTIPPVIRFNRAYCNVVDGTLSVSYHGALKDYAIPIEQCTFYKENVA